MCYVSAMNTAQLRAGSGATKQHAVMDVRMGGGNMCECAESQSIVVANATLVRSIELVHVRRL
jgi:hypothetical protein